MDFGKLKFSASNGGMGILVVGTATGTATLIHTAVAGIVDGIYDEIYLYLTNNHTSAVVVTIEYGNADIANNIVCSIASKSGNYWVIPGQILQAGLTVKAFATTPNVVTAHGWVNTMRAA